jgi:DNA-binding SARP family transcriptional activator
MNIRIFLAGQVGVAVGSEPVIQERHFRDRQGRRVFVYLVCCRSRPVPRAELAQIIWPEEMPRPWEPALSAIVSRIRALLECPDLKLRGVTLSNSFGQYQLSLPTDTWVDLEAVSSALDEAESALRAGDPRRAFGFAAVVYAIANRPFLSGDSGEWVESQRRALERQYLRALECLGEIWLSTGEPALAVENAMQAVTIDPYRESSHRLLMRAHAATGNKGEAIRTYHRLRRLLVDELGVDPSAETKALHLDLLRRDDL